MGTKPLALSTVANCCCIYLFLPHAVIPRALLWGATQCDSRARFKSKLYLNLAVGTSRFMVVLRTRRTATAYDMLYIYLRIRMYIHYLFYAACCTSMLAETVRHAQAAERAHLSVHRGLHQTHRHRVPLAHDNAGMYFEVYVLDWL